ncbi:PRC-barrel domain-containing protein [Novosphingobium aerophilum]|jgi:butyrate kinase|uniref:PRC-barrel domain-containing protein n=1 Tax=Novosphingobium pentaromativorans TaxID=205844 RepID=A0A2W5QQ64_9SPHN|nr:PRC-barrel domain-containing protein [Novosphingobium sp. TCA1]PZQ53630.1 MAG: hypothetical protein DI555_15355 [Novosphingobium pentaromativorans]GFE75687.1 hypothetical protein NTCA1_33360 [Novosphingobium sp. TCA1]
MKKIIIALMALGLSVPALADGAAVKRNDAVYSANGTRIGKVERVLTDSDGTATAVRIIFRGKFITIPVATLTAGEKGVTTSMSTDDIKKL